MKKKNQLIYLEGKKIYLRPFLKKDLTKNYLRWINNYENNTFMEAGKFPTSEFDLQKYFEQNYKSKNSILFAVCNKKGDHVGNCLISNIDWVNRRATYGRLVGQKNKAPKGTGTEILRLLLKYCFEILNLNVMWTVVCSKNYSSIKSNMNAGLKIGGTIEDFFFRNNKLFDCTIFYISKKEYLGALKKIN